MIRTLTQAVLVETLAARYERSKDRRGYRNGKSRRSTSTGIAATVIELPRVRISERSGEKEWQSGLIGRYQRHGASPDPAHWVERLIRGALSPLSRGAPLAKRAILRPSGV